MWTHTDDLTILANLIVRSNYKDDVMIHYTIYPCEGYVLRIPILDEYQMNEDGDYVLDENGNKILVTPYRSYGGATINTNYDWNINPNNYYAEKYNEDMQVF